MSEKHQEQVSKANKDNSKLQQEAAHNKSRWWMIVWTETLFDIGPAYFTIIFEQLSVVACYGESISRLYIGGLALF